MSQSNQWSVDPSHSNAHFTVKHMMITNVRGEFSKLAGTVSYDAAKPEATQIDATVDVASLSTRDAQRDGHLKSPDFFDLAKFPNITFKSKSVKAKSKEAITVTDEYVRDNPWNAVGMAAGVGFLLGLGLAAGAFLRRRG